MNRAQGNMRNQMGNVMVERGSFHPHAPGVGHKAFVGSHPKYSAMPGRRWKKRLGSVNLRFKFSVCSEVNSEFSIARKRGSTTLHRAPAEENISLFNLWK